MSKYIKLSRSYVDSPTFDLLSSYCDKMGYLMKYKKLSRGVDIFNGIVRQVSYYDIIVEKVLSPSKKRHGFVRYESGKFYLVYKDKVEDITFNINLSTSISNVRGFKMLLEPAMFYVIQVQEVDSVS